MKILYCAYGRAGLLILDKLLGKIHQKENIFCLTNYDSGNMDLINLLNSSGVKFSFSPIKETEGHVELFGPDLILSIHYRELIPSGILRQANLASINLHPSLLPKYRGTFSAPWAIINGEKRTGITYHFMNERFDEGDLIFP